MDVVSDCLQRKERSKHGLTASLPVEFNLIKLTFNRHTSNWATEQLSEILLSSHSLEVGVISFGSTFVGFQRPLHQFIFIVTISLECQTFHDFIF